MKRPKDFVDLKSYEDKISRIVEIEYYLTHLIISRREQNYQPSTGDENQKLRDEATKLRIELGITNKSD
jgi:hypothetical protein